MFFLFCYVCIVVGGWLRLKPGVATKANWYYQVPTNTFFEADRSIRDIFRGPDDPRETLSSWAGRTDKENKWWMYLFNLLMLDPRHCKAYVGT